LIDIAASAMAPSLRLGNAKRRAANAAAAQQSSTVPTATAGSSACCRSSVTPPSAPNTSSGSPTLNTTLSSLLPAETGAHSQRRNAMPRKNNAATAASRQCVMTHST
jgi:hypothetical protein